MEIKRRKKQRKPKRLSPHELLVRKLKRDLKKEQDEVITKYDKYLLAEGNKEIEDSINLNDLPPKN